MIRRNHLAWILVAAMSLLLFASACGKKKPTPTAGQQTAATEATETAAPETTAAPEQTAPPEHAGLNLLVYMIGSDLESASSAATKDLDEMAASGLDTMTVNLLVYAGGTRKWNNDLSTDRNTLLRLQNGAFTEDASFEAASMGDPETLSGILNYVSEHYAADRTALICWDHGNGPMLGFGKDTLHGNDALTLPELRAGLAASPFGPENKLSFLGFDACLMASIELAATVSDYADYMVSSQEVEPNFGWCYDFLPEAGKAETAELCKQIVDCYVDNCESYFEKKSFFRSDVTLSVVDLSAARALEQAVNELFSTAGTTLMADFGNLVRERVDARALARASTGSEYDLVDLNDLAVQMSAAYPARCAALQAALQRAIVYSRTNTSGCCGLSLYYPYYNRAYYTDRWQADYRALGVLPSYRKYMDDYGRMWLSGTQNGAFARPLTVDEGETPGDYTVQLTPDQAESFAKSGYYILSREGEEVYRLCYLSPNVRFSEGTLTAHFNGKVLAWSNDLGEKGIPLCQEEGTVDGITHFTSYAFVERDVGTVAEDNFLNCELQLDADEANETVTLRTVLRDDGSADLQGGKREVIDLSEWQMIEFPTTQDRYPERNEDGVLLDFFNWNASNFWTAEETWLANGLHFTYLPLQEAGNAETEYYICFQITDVYGNTCCSELRRLPMGSGKENPTPETPDSAQALRWEDGAELPLLDAKGVAASLVAARDPETGRPICALQVQNRNDAAVWLQLQDMEVDGVDLLMSQSQTVLAGSTGFVQLACVPEVCKWKGGEPWPASLAFTLSAQDYDSGAVLIREKDFRVELHSLEAPARTVQPFMDAMTAEQILFEADGLSVRLLELGSYAGSAVTKEAQGLEGALMLENRADDRAGVALEGMICNGIYFPLTSKGIMLEAESRTMHSFCFTGVENSVISSISSVELIFRYLPAGAEEIRRITVPVILTQHGVEPAAQVSGREVYRDADVVITEAGFSRATAAERRQLPRVSSYRVPEEDLYTWTFWIENNSDQELSFYPHECAGLAPDENWTFTTELDQRANVWFLINRAVRVAPHTKVLAAYAAECETAPAAPVLQLRWEHNSSAVTDSYRPEAGAVLSGELALLTEEQTDEPNAPEPAAPVTESLPAAPEGEPWPVPELPEAPADADGWRVLWQGEAGTLCLNRILDYEKGHPVWVLRLTGVEGGCELNNLRLNGALPVQSRWFSGRQSAAGVGGCRFAVIEDWDTLLELSRSPGLQSLQCEASFRNADYDLVAKEQIAVSFPAWPEPTLGALPYAGARAERQILLETEEIRVTLLGCGRYPGTSESETEHLRGALLVENRTDKQVPYSFRGVSVNGYYFEMRGPNISLSPGCVFQDTILVKDSDLKEQGIGEIESIRLLLATEADKQTGRLSPGSGVWYPLALTEHGTAAPLPAGKELASLGGVRLTALEQTESEDCWYWTVLAENEGETGVMLRAADEQINGEPMSWSFGSPFFSFGEPELGSGTARILRWRLRKEDFSDRPELSFRLQVLTAGGGKLLIQQKEPMVFSPDDSDAG